MISNVKFVCLNPKCLFPQNRIFLLGQNACHRKCSNWKFPQDENGANNIYSQDTLQGQLSINFGNEGLMAIQKVLRLEMWPQQLSSLFDNLKFKINEDIEQIKAQKIKQFQEIYKLAEAAKQEIKVIKQKMGTEDIQNGNFSTKSIEQIEKKGFLNIYQAEKIRKIYEAKTKESLNMIGDLLQSQKPTFDQLDYIRKINALQKANELFFQSNDNPIHDKIQKLASLFKSQMIKVTFDSSVGLYQTTCWKCQNICYSPKQDPTRLACMQQFFIHLTTHHGKQVYLNYMSRVLKYQVEQITIQALVSKISAYNINEILLIDRQNAGTIQKPLQLKNGLEWVEVVNKDNKNLARGQFIVADSKRKDAADIIITIMIYQVIKAGVKKVTLVTKDHFGITLMQLINSQFKNSRLECMQPKQFMQKMQVNLNNKMKD